MVFLLGGFPGKEWLAIYQSLRKVIHYAHLGTQKPTSIAMGYVGYFWGHLTWADQIWSHFMRIMLPHTFCAHDSTGSWAHHQEKKACKHWYIFHNTFSKLTQSRLKWAGYHPSKWQAFCENSAHSKASRIIIIYIHLHKFPKENLCPANREPCSESFLPVLQIRQSHYSRDGWFKAKTLLISLLRAGGLLWDLINIS